MSTQFLLYIIYGVIGLFAVIVIAYLILRKRMQRSDYQQIKKLREGTESKSFSTESKSFFTSVNVFLPSQYVFLLKVIVF